MKIQQDWLKQYVDCTLPAGDLGHLLTMAGLEIEAYEKVKLADGQISDVLELNVTPNRGYCLSHIGVAREVAALTGKNLNLPNLDQNLGETPFSEPVQNRLKVTLDEPGLCPRYAAMVIDNVKVAPSPQWLQDRLTAIGLRPINNIVDITNFVLMEYGQPLHAFDLDLLKGQQIIIRRAREKEPFEALDGTQLTLNQDALVIADGERSVALAGVMGGANSQVNENTQTIVLESAYFDPTSIRKTSKLYGLRSDSSYRFERGVDIDAVISAQSRAALMIAELGGGTIAEGRIDEYPEKRPVTRIDFRVKRCNSILGTSLDADTIGDYLKALNMEIDSGADETFKVSVPSSRPMIEREIDLIEEIARLHGYDQIQVTDPVGRLSPIKLTALQTTSRTLQQLMCSLGYTEAVNYSFLEEENALPFLEAFTEGGASTIPLDNPISLDLGTMRTSLLPGLIKSSVRNIHRGGKSLRLFELGSSFFKVKDEHHERPCLAAVVTGPYPADVWSQTGKGYDFFDLKGTLESLLSRFQIQYEYRPTSKPYFSKGPSIDCLAGGNIIASLGELTPELAKQFELEQPLFAFEIDLEAAIGALPPTVRFESLPKFPGSYRDISVLVDKSVNAGTIEQGIRQAGQPLLKRVELYDHFEGKKLEPGKKSLTFALTFQSPDRTLTDDEVNPVFESIVKHLTEKLGANLREACS